uniref:Centrosomal protein of 78 kDa n=1 Tax=Anopheles farauti TaxID=69004 RepID=A0A182QHJ3_9DIPT
MSSEAYRSKAEVNGMTEKRTGQRMKDFHHRYLALCRSKNFQPQPEIVKQKDRATLDVYGDRFKAHDWQLIMHALREDNSLRYLALRMRKTYTEVEVSDSEKSSFLNKRLFKQLIDSLTVFIRKNKVIENFIIEGLPIVRVRLGSIVTGLHQNSSLTELNLARCSIGDDGCELLCSKIKFLPNLQLLNLSACQLTVKGCQAIADLIKFQKMQRYVTCWEMSLRYGDIKDDKIMGLRHLYLCHNPAIGDDGLLELTDVLKDDAWVRQVHVCNCGLTDCGAQFLIECLNVNNTIEKFDISDNVKISDDACREILVKLGAKLDDENADSASPGGKHDLKTMAGLKAHSEFLETQLEMERHRNIQLESMVEQLQLQIGDYAEQISELNRELSSLVKARNDLLEKVKKLENKSARKAGGSILRKSLSEGFVQSNLQTQEQQLAGISKSTAVVTLGEIEEQPLHGTGRMIERFIGDCGDCVEKVEDLCEEKKDHN